MATASVKSRWEPEELRLLARKEALQHEEISALTERQAATQLQRVHSTRPVEGIRKARKRADYLRFLEEELRRVDVRGQLRPAAPQEALVEDAGIANRRDRRATSPPRTPSPPLLPASGGESTMGGRENPATHNDYPGEGTHEDAGPNPPDERLPASPGRRCTPERRASPPPPVNHRLLVGAEGVQTAGGRRIFNEGDARRCLSPGIVAEAPSEHNDPQSDSSPSTPDSVVSGGEDRPDGGNANSVNAVQPDTNQIRQALLDHAGSLTVDPSAGWGANILLEALACCQIGEIQLAKEALRRHADQVLSVGSLGEAQRRGRRAPARRGDAEGGLRRPVPRRTDGRDQARRRAFAQVQSKWDAAPKHAADLVLSGDWAVPPTRVDAEDLFRFWGGLLSRPSLADDRVPDPRPMKAEIAAPVTTAELERFLKTLKNSAPGPDKMPVRLLKAIPGVILSLLYNLWLYCGFLPAKFKRCRTVLIPKVPNPGPGQHRPLTIGAHLVRLLHKIIAARVTESGGLGRCQKAFVPVDGCLENLAILDALIGRAKTLKHDVHLAFLDMAKAFDSCYHQTIERGMQRAGIPQVIREYVMETYTDSTTVIECNGDFSKPVPLTRGVKQGDPLSPVLFNWVIDEAVAAAEETGMGVELGGERISALAFADDIVLVSRTSAGLDELIASMTGTLSQGGLEVNPEKCRTLSLCVDKKRKRWYVSTRTAHFVNGQRLATMGPEDEIKYLGILYGASGSAPSYGKLLEEGLQNLTKAPLKPQQRMHILINHLIPRLNHRLVLGKVYMTQLRRMDRRVRQAVRGWLRLPNDAPVAGFHAPVASGGMGIPDFTTTIRLQKQKRFEKLLTSSDPVVRAAAMEPVLQSKFRRWAPPATIGREEVRSSKARGTEWANVLHAKVDGQALRPAADFPEVQRWVSSGAPHLTGREYIKAIKTRAGLLPTPERRARGRPGNSGLCDTCRTPGTLGHISQTCPKTWGGRIKRHDNVAKSVAGWLDQLDFRVEREMCVPFGGTFRKPDIVAVKGNTCYVLDVQVTADRYPLSLAHNNKRQKYDQPELKRNISELTGVDSVQVSSVTLNWRGLWAKESVVALRGMGLTNRQLELCSVKALTWTHSLYSMWSKRTGV